MATATLYNGPTLIHACDAATDATNSCVAAGNAIAVVTDFKVHGTASLGFTFSTNMSKSYVTFTPTASVDVSSTPHLRMWLNYGLSGMLETYANGGIRFVVDDGTNEGEWVVGGSDTYSGGWRLFQVDLTTTPDYGTAPSLTAVTIFGFRCYPHSTAVLRNATNTWVDNVHFSNGYSFYGGTTSDRIKLADLYAADLAAGWGIIQRYNGVYFGNAGIVGGDSTGTNDCYVDFSGDVLIFTDELVDANLYKIDGVGNATGTTDISIDGMVIKSVGPRFYMDMTDTNLDTLSMTGNTIGAGGTIDFKASQTVTGNIFDDCLQIDPSTSTFESNIISNYSETAVNGALLWPGGTTVKDCTFTNNDEAIEVTQTTDQTFDNLQFSENIDDVHLNNGGTDINVSKNNGSNPTSQVSTGGGTVTFVGSSVTTKIIAQTADGTKVSGCYAALFTNETGSLPYNTTVTIANSGTTATVTHTAHGLVTGDKVLIKGASLSANNGVYTITVTGVNAYTYTMSTTPGSSPTGTITATFAFVYGTTDVNGEISLTRVIPAIQEAYGWVRKSTTSPYYKTGLVSGDVSNTSNTTFTALMFSDE